jgi:hypothetical protein
VKCSIPPLGDRKRGTVSHVEAKEIFESLFYAADKFVSSGVAAKARSVFLFEMERIHRQHAQMGRAAVGEAGVINVHEVIWGRQPAGNDNAAAPGLDGDRSGDGQPLPGDHVSLDYFARGRRLIAEAQIRPGCRGRPALARGHAKNDDGKKGWDLHTATVREEALALMLRKVPR